MQKLNLGCGFNHKSDCVNVDNFAMCNPDVLHDLETFPYPWDDNTIDEIHMDHVLEHLGNDSKTYLQIFKELYRICRHDAKLFINVPHWMHENFAHDPTHCRIVTPVGLAMFDKDRNRNDLKNNGSESKLGLMIDVDFKLEGLIYVADPQWQEIATIEGWSDKTAEFKMKSVPGVCQEIRFVLRVNKPQE